MRRLMIGLLAALVGCSSTPGDLERNSSASSAVKTYPENYQEIYRRVSSAATRCNAGNINAYASYNVNAQLYNELGFGEITMSMVNLGKANFFWKAKIEKTGAGSKMTVFAGNSLTKDRMLDNVIQWAAGSESC